MHTCTELTRKGRFLTPGRLRMAVSCCRLWRRMWSGQMSTFVTTKNTGTLSDSATPRCSLHMPTTPCTVGRRRHPLAHPGAHVHACVAAGGKGCRLQRRIRPSGLSTKRITEARPLPSRETSQGVAAVQNIRIPTRIPTRPEARLLDGY